MTWWVITRSRIYPHPNSLSVIATTNVTDHLFMAWSYVRPRRSRILRNIRGRWILCGYDYIWDTPNIVPQTEPGDTITHSWQLTALTPASTIWFYLFAPDGPYGLEIQGPLCHVTLPSIGAWPKNVMVATQTKGIYTTPNFSGPEGPHPIWLPQNDGLLSLEIRQLHADPSDPAVRQYALVAVNGDPVLYRRQPGVTHRWQFILLNSQAIELTGAAYGLITWVATNWNRPGTLYVLFWGGTWNSGTWCLRSFDYGSSWQAFQILPGTAGNSVSMLVAARAQGSSPYLAGDVIYLAFNSYVGGRQTLRVSYDNGETWWPADAVGLSFAKPRCHVDPTDQSIAYLGSTLAGYEQRYLYRSEEHGQNLTQVGGFHDLAILLDPFPAQMWIHPTNHSFIKILAVDHMWQTWDYCDTWEDLGPIMVHAEHLHIPDLAPDLLYIGRNESAPLPPDLGWPHVLFVSDDHGATMIGKCGANAQYSDGRGDSIPYDCGGIAPDGILPLY